MNSNTLHTCRPRGITRLFFLHTLVRGAVPEKTCAVIHRIKSRPRQLHIHGSCLGRLALPRADYLVPMPLHRLRRRMRGFNQSEHIALGMARVSGMPVRNRGILRRRVHTPPLRSLPAGRRAACVRDAFQVVLPAAVAGRSIILVDDVFTSGATMRSAAAVLFAAGARRVYGAVLYRLQ